MVYTGIHLLRGVAGNPTVVLWWWGTFLCCASSILVKETRVLIGTERHTLLLGSSCPTMIPTMIVHRLLLLVVHCLLLLVVRTDIALSWMLWVLVSMFSHHR